MERYLVFAGDHYYPSGGWDDFHGDYASLEQAKAIAAELEKEGGRWAHIADLELGNALHDIHYELATDRDSAEGRHRVSRME